MPSGVTHDTIVDRVTTAAVGRFAEPGSELADRPSVVGGSADPSRVKMAGRGYCSQSSPAQFIELVDARPVSQ
jgi:hypothetical protein